MTKPLHTRPQQGFTLIEVLAALVVLALSLGGMLKAAGFYASNASYLQDKTIAGWVAHNEMVRVQMARTWPETGRSDGEVEMAGRDWRWQRDVEETPDDRIRRITITVQLDDGDEASSLAKVSGFFAQPATQSPAGRQ